MRTLLVAFTATALAALSACRAKELAEGLSLGLPDGSGRSLELRPSSAFAEYVELAGLRNELRITLASYELSCERYAAPGPRDLAVFVTLGTPAGQALRPGSYPVGAAPSADAGTSPLSKASVLSVIRHGTRGYVLSPGGSLELSHVELAKTGSVAGLLAFEFPGDGTRPASSARGKFAARICRSDAEPSL